MRIYTADYVRSRQKLANQGYGYVHRMQVIHGKDAIVQVDPVTPEALLPVLHDLQAQTSLHWADGLDLVLLPWVGGYYVDGAFQMYTAVTYPPCIAFSAGNRTVEQVRNVMAHELGHALEERLLVEPESKQAAMNLLGLSIQDYPVTNAVVNQRWWEILAEYASFALWNAPVDSDVVAVPTDRIDALREYLLGLIGPSQAVEFEVLGAGHVEIVMRIGDPIYKVDGNEKLADVAPFIRNKRTFVSLRFVAEALGAKVDWDAATQTISIMQEVFG